MAVPKSVVKIKKGGVEYISNVDATKYTIKELSRAALRDTAKLIRKRAKDLVPKNTGNLKKAIGTWVRSTKGYDIPYLQIGVYNRNKAGKKGLNNPFYAM